MWNLLSNTLMYMKNKKIPKVLINIPQGIGGVANFYECLSTLKSENIVYNHIGKVKRWIAPIHILYNYIVFIFKCFSYDIIMVNPSLSKLCIYRDGIYCYIAKILGKKTVVFWRGFNHEYFNNVVRNKYVGFLNKTLFKADHTMVLGESILAALNSIGCNTPYSVHTTVLPSEFQLKSPRIFRDDKFVILFLARLEISKGIMEALNAYSILKERFPHINLVIAGDGKAMRAVRQKITSENLKDITILGHITGESKYEAYRNADMYFFPSYYEGMPNSMLEAMGMALPVVTSSVGAITDFFENNKMGYMIDDIKNVDCYVEAITKLITLPNKENISKYNYIYAQRMFIDKVVISRIESTLNTII